jgi:hypothetical protein
MTFLEIPADEADRLEKRDKRNRLAEKREG